MEFEDTCYLTEGLDSCEPMFNSVPWTDLVSVCIDYRLATLDFLDPCLNTQVTNKPYKMFNFLRPKEFWPLIGVKMWGFFNIFRTNGRILIKLCICIDIA